MKSLLVAVFTLTSTLGAYAQEPGVQTVKGTVLSSGNVSFAIETIGGRRMTFLVLADTTMPRARISAGETVTVSYRQLDAERLGATTVTPFAAGTRVAATSPGGVATATEEGDRGRTLSLIRLVAMALLVGSGVMALVALARAHGRRHGTV